MAIGFVLMHVLSLHENEVFNKLSKIPEVVEVHSIFGEYDLIVKIEAKDYESIAKIIFHKIKTIDGVTDTKTLTGIKIGVRRICF
jgi:DNA-binding Lrp family transcriptional regulator